MPSSSHHHFVLCLFLLSFLCVDSQSSYVVILRNESPNNVATDQCFVNDDIDPGEEVLLNPGMSNNITTTFFPGKSYTLYCSLQLGEKYADLFTLFDSNDTSICHVPSEECVWKIQEDGLCMLSEGKCVMFGWDYNSLLNRHIASEATKYIASDELKSENIN
ncbi:hypothetical protein H5410_048354 [Solanum commersonii]|uniref:S-protein homolog n=1 Tax=Solanum commersonii TaxID=4109 RepID=A0A9J5XLK3_SOLCO|nr:hypothetical protein H5410_048354 [Solanum commersonii]